MHSQNFATKQLHIMLIVNPNINMAMITSPHYQVAGIECNDPVVLPSREHLQGRNPSWRDTGQAERGGGNL